ncbi:MAG: type IV secretory system conjugative DNA transfer family protein [Gammaproteobacteria bacterium]|jgi:defect-in-organelle-trafficking protein DotC|nr:type IV secretory system conjugative DNA transfer family protein [Gammaproteobacteria bacterium]
MKQYISSTLLVVGLATITVSCSTPPAYQSTLGKYHAVKFNPKGGTLSGIRNIGLRDTALSLGARAGLAWRASEINVLVSRNERQLDLIYNFNSLLLDNNVLPPVLIEGRQTLEQTADDVIRVADRAYTIQAQARFVTMAPTWRDYLKMQYKDPELPDTSLMPRNEVEKNVWDKYLDEGWQAGVTQADVIFAENLGRLKRDYEGMIRYHTLLAQNMVSVPFVAQVNLGVTGGDSQMAINDRILRITTLPQFNNASSEWTALVTEDERQLAPEDR